MGELSLPDLTGLARLTVKGIHTPCRPFRRDQVGFRVAFTVRFFTAKPERRIRSANLFVDLGHRILNNS